MSIDTCEHTYIYVCIKSVSANDGNLYLQTSCVSQGLQHASFSVSLWKAVAWAHCWVTRSHFLPLDLRFWERIFSEINAFSSVKWIFTCCNGLEENGSSDLKAIFETTSQNNYKLFWSTHRNRGWERTRPESDRKWRSMELIIRSRSQHAAFCSFACARSFCH